MRIRRIGQTGKEQEKVSFSIYDPSYDSDYAKFLKKLRRMKLFSVQDMDDFDHRTRTCHPWSRGRFEVLFEMSNSDKRFVT